MSSTVRPDRTSRPDRKRAVHTQHLKRKRTLMARKNTEKNGNGGTLGFEGELFKAADKLRGNMEPSDYKHVALGLIFLKYISDAFEAKHKTLMTEDPQIGRAHV